MRKSSFFAAFLFAILLTLGTAGHALAHDHDGWRHRGAWAHRWNHERFERGRWAYGRGYANPGWWGRGDDDDWGRRWGGYNRYPNGYGRGGWWHHFDRDDD